MILQVKNISKQFPGVQALEEVNMAVNKPGEIIGLAGENGAGKSTLFKVIAGIYGADGGEMLLSGKPYKPMNYREAVASGVSMVFQEGGLVPNLYAYENIFLSHEDHFTKFGVLNRSRMVKDAKRNLERMDINLDPAKVTSSFSLDERQMIEVCKAFSLSALYNITNPIILLDEPTSGLNEESIKTLFKKINEFRAMASFVFVSHRLSELMELCDRIYVLKDGRNVAEIRPRESSEEELHELMVGRKAEKEFYRESLQSSRYKENEIVIAGRDLTDAEQAFRRVNFDLRKGQILGVGGLLGCGKWELGRAVAGIRGLGECYLEYKDRKVVKHNLNEMIRLGVGYLPKERKTEGIIPYFQVTWNVTLPMISDLAQWKSNLLSKKRETQIAEEYSAKLKIKTPSVSVLCFSLSGGNQQKVVIAKWLAKKLDVLIMDNPTRGIDVGAKEEIYALIRDLTAEGLAILLITDDLLELIGLSDEIMIMKDGEVTFRAETPAENKPTEQELVRYML